MRALFVFLSIRTVAYAAPPPDVDLVIYGSTPAGILAAQAFRDASPPQATIVLLDPGNRVGGMPASGLGNTDVGAHPTIIGGFARDFFVENARQYDANATLPQWLLEPHIAEAIFNNLLRASRVTVLSALGGIESVQRSETGDVLAVKPLYGSLVTARFFIDASYEGDLLAAAGVPYALGRESRAQYAEAVAGRLGDNFTFVLPISPYDSEGSLLPMMSTAAFVNEGDADDLLQAYNFRLCLTNVSSLRVPIPPPTSFDSPKYELFRRWIAASPPHLSSFFGYMFPIPWHDAPAGECCKFDFNSDFTVSFDFVGASQAWPLANASERAAIWSSHLDYHLSLFYVLQHDPATPEAVRAEAQSFGLCRDEFPDSGHWPPQLYVREARRMVGGSVFTANGIRNGHVADSVALGGYALDVHHTQRVPCMPLAPAAMWAPPPFPQHPATCRLLQPDAPWPGPGVDVWVASEGHMGNNGAPGGGGASGNGVFELPYSLLVPPRGTPNLLVPVAVSASHAAFNAIRLEPQWMMLGQAAGAAAALALAEGVVVQDLNITALQGLLAAQGAVLHWSVTPA